MSRLTIRLLILGAVAGGVSSLTWWMISTGQRDQSSQQLQPRLTKSELLIGKWLLTEGDPRLPFHARIVEEYTTTGEVYLHVGSASPRDSTVYYGVYELDGDNIRFLWKDEDGRGVVSHGAVIESITADRLVLLEARGERVGRSVLTREISGSK